MFSKLLTVFLFIFLSFVEVFLGVKTNKNRYISTFPADT